MLIYSYKHMNIRHRSTHHAGIVLLGLVCIGFFFGGIGAALNSSVFDISDASTIDSADQRLLDAAERRRERREARLARAREQGRLMTEKQTTYPMHANLLTPTHTSANEWEVTLNTGRVQVPALGIDTPLHWPSRTYWDAHDWGNLENQMQYGLLNGVIAYPHSPEIGGYGNIVIAGHSSPPTFEAMGSHYGSVFAQLPDIEIGEEIAVEDRYGRTHLYTVYETEVLHPTNTKILKQDRGNRDITLMTCYPVGTTRNRFIVHARYEEQKYRETAMK
jgi:LPXTG-site transpeptidase (sortase) family protein